VLAVAFARHGPLERVVIEFGTRAIETMLVHITAGFFIAAPLHEAAIASTHGLSRVNAEAFPLQHVRNRGMA
jgi:hypothetical protein